MVVQEVAHYRHDRAGIDHRRQGQTLKAVQDELPHAFFAQGRRVEVTGDKEERAHEERGVDATEDVQEQVGGRVLHRAVANGPGPGAVVRDDQHGEEHAQVVDVIEALGLTVHLDPHMDHTVTGVRRWS